MAVEGHVLQASSSSKLPGVLVMAWPCGLATSTDALGAFRVSCPQGIDSLTLSCVGFDTQVVVSPASHVDVWMEDLKVMLGQAQVAANRFSESEASALDQPTLMQALDRTPGLESLDLGAGMIQPVVRGLFAQGAGDLRVAAELSARSGVRRGALARDNDAHQTVGPAIT